MAIELMILSGSRQRESLKFTRNSLTIGDDSTFDVAFSPKRDPHARRQRAKIELDENGWWIHNRGSGPWFINRRELPTEGSAMLRSGDVLRLSELGPDIRFVILADRDTSPTKRSDGKAAARRPTAADRKKAIPKTAASPTPDREAAEQDETPPESHGEAPAEEDAVTFEEESSFFNAPPLLLILLAILALGAAAAVVGAVVAILF